MDKKEYLQTVAEQIRCVKARDAVKTELEHHIEDQKEAFMMDGMKEEEASVKAVEEMGDPVKTGVTLDLVHRPKMQWKMIAAVIGLSVLGVLLQYAITTSTGVEECYDVLLMRTKILIVALIVMSAFCFFDYSRIGLYGKVGAVFLISVILVSNILFGYRINGQAGYVTFRGINIRQLLYLYIPFFGGILYSYKGQGGKSFYKSIAWMSVPCLVALLFSDLSLAICLFIVMMIQLSVVVKMGWIESSKNVLRITAAVTVAVLAACVVYFVFISTQEANSYVMQMTREVLKESVWIGQGTDQIGNVLIEINNNFIITYAMSTYGIFPGILLMGMLALFVFGFVKLSVSQKNQLGMVMGLGCSLVLAVQIVSYMLVNLSVLPLTSVFLPLFSYGGTGTVVSFALIGIQLSVYRYQNVLPVSPCKKHEIAL